MNIYIVAAWNVFARKVISSLKMRKFGKKMDNSRNQPELETLDYKPDTGSTGDWTNGGKIDKEPANRSPATLGMNSHIRLQAIKPGARVNKVETDLSNLPGREHHKDCECGNCPEQPNLKNLKIIEAIECLVSQINDRLGEIIITNKEPGDSTRKWRKGQALEDVSIFKTTLLELRKAFE